MRDDLVATGNRHVDEVRQINRDLIEKALQMRCLSYLAQVKARLLTETIFEVDNSKKSLLKINQDLELRTETVEAQRLQLEQQLAELSRVKEELQQTNLALEQKNRELERLNRLFVDREFRIKELRDRLAKYETKA